MEHPGINLKLILRNKVDSKLEELVVWKRTLCPLLVRGMT